MSKDVTIKAVFGKDKDGNWEIAGAEHPFMEWYNRQEKQALLTGAEALAEKIKKYESINDHLKDPEEQTVADRYYQGQITMAVDAALKEYKESIDG